MSSPVSSSAHQPAASKAQFFGHSKCLAYYSTDEKALWCFLLVFCFLVFVTFTNWIASMLRLHILSSQPACPQIYISTEAPTTRITSAHISCLALQKTPFNLSSESQFCLTFFGYHTIGNSRTLSTVNTDFATLISLPSLKCIRFWHDRHSQWRVISCWLIYVSLFAMVPPYTPQAQLNEYFWPHFCIVWKFF